MKYFPHQKNALLFVGVIAAAVLLFSSGCAEKKYLSLDPNYSWNLTKIGEDWPPMRRGEPDLKDSENLQAVTAPAPGACGERRIQQTPRSRRINDIDEPAHRRMLGLVPTGTDVLRAWASHWRNA